MCEKRRFISPSRGISTLREMVLTIPDELKNHTAFVNSLENRYEKLTYGDVRRMVECLGNALHKFGVQTGDRVALLSENRSEWALVYLAVTGIGAIIVPLDALLTDKEIAPLLADSGAQMVFTSEGQKAKIDAARASAPAVQHIILFDEAEETREIVEKQEAQRLVERLLSMKFIPDAVRDIFHKHRQNMAYSDKQNILLKNKDYQDFSTLIETGCQICRDGCNGFAAAQVTPDMTAAIIYTSGTTGQPKGVMLSHRNLTSNADEIQMLDKMSHNDRWVTLLPLHHTFPAMAGFLVPFITRGTIKFLATLRTDVILKAFKDMKVTSIPIVPLFLEKVYKNIFKTVKDKGGLSFFMFRMFIVFSRFCKRLFHFNPGRILFRQVREKLGLNHLKYFISGGGPIAREILKGFDIMGIFVGQGYGLTETSPTVSCNSLQDNRFGSVGYMLKSVEVKIDQPDRHGNGEIWLKAPYVMQGYYKQPEKTKEILDADGFLHTGDIGRLDKDGFLWITGRQKNIIVTSGGKNIYPEELENLLLQSAYISEVVVIPSRDMTSNSEEPYAIIYPDFDTVKQVQDERGKAFSEEELYDFIGSEIKRLTQELAAYKKITGFELLYEELPKTSSKKVKRFLFNKKTPS